MGNIAAKVYQPDPQPQLPVQVNVKYSYYVSVWRQRYGFRWDNVQGYHAPAVAITLEEWPRDEILILVDPLTAISMNMVTPEELQYPPGILAAFNLLSKEPS